MVSDLVNVYPNTLVTHTKDVARNVFLTLIVRQTRPVFETNVKILAVVVAARMPSVK